MVIAVFGNLITGFRCFGPFDCARDAISHCGDDCVIVPTKNFRFRLYDGPILLVGDIVEGFRCFGPFADKAHADCWESEQRQEKGRLFLRCCLQSVS